MQNNILSFRFLSKSIYNILILYVVYLSLYTCASLNLDTSSWWRRQRLRWPPLIEYSHTQNNERARAACVCVCLPSASVVCCEQKCVCHGSYFCPLPPTSALCTTPSAPPQNETHSHTHTKQTYNHTFSL